MSTKTQSVSIPAQQPFPRDDDGQPDLPDHPDVTPEGSEEADPPAQIEETGPEQENDGVEKADDSADAASGHQDENEWSIVDSLFLHLLSEHEYYALGLPDAEAETLHQQLHQEPLSVAHDLEDHSFRPARALDIALAASAIIAQEHTYTPVPVG